MRDQGRISGACFDAARGIIPGLKVFIVIVVICTSKRRNILLLELGWGLVIISVGFLFFFQVKGTDYPTKDGTCIRDYIDVSDLIDAHVKALAHATRGKVGIYNVGTGKGNLLT